MLRLLRLVAFGDFPGLLLELIDLVKRIAVKNQRTRRDQNQSLQHRRQREMLAPPHEGRIEQVDLLAHSTFSSCLRAAPTANKKRCCSSRSRNCGARSRSSTESSEKSSTGRYKFVAR